MTNIDATYCLVMYAQATTNTQQTVIVSIFTRSWTNTYTVNNAQIGDGDLYSFSAMGMSTKPLPFMLFRHLPFDMEILYVPSCTSLLITVPCSLVCLSACLPF